ncbi:hypothetical protein [Streptomyces sp. NPDC059003]|uniref:hypothetical protein n=1 Tax=Streptomyces sp. NPDC059003 TaxID=3346691 RepID=UPI003685F7A4
MYSAPELASADAGMTALELGYRFQLLAMDIVRFKGATHPDVADALEALREVQGDVMGGAGPYPVLDTAEDDADPLYLQLHP